MQSPSEVEAMGVRPQGSPIYLLGRFVSARYTLQYHDLQHHSVLSFPPVTLFGRVFSLLPRLSSAGNAHAHNPKRERFASESPSPVTESATSSQRAAELSVCWLMLDRTTEGSPLLGAADPMQGWRYSDRPGSARALLGGDSRGRSRNGGSRQDAIISFLRRHWRASAGVAGVLMFSMALAGMVAIFSTIQRERTPSGGMDLEEVKDIDVRTPAALPEIIPRESCER